MPEGCGERATLSIKLHRRRLVVESNMKKTGEFYVDLREGARLQDVRQDS